MFAFVLNRHHVCHKTGLKVDLSDQSRPDERVNNPLEGMVEDGMNMKDADPFFDTSAGKVYNGQGVQKSQAVLKFYLFLPIHSN